MGLIGIHKNNGIVLSFGTLAANHGEFMWYFASRIDVKFNYLTYPWICAHFYLEPLFNRELVAF